MFASAKVDAYAIFHYFRPVMTSLKSFIPKLAGLLHLSPHALYERQRVLVKAGLLPNVAGRGPGSGVRLSVDAVCTLIISMLATDDLAASEEPTRLLAKVRQSQIDLPIKMLRPLSDLWPTRTFQAAIRAALTHPADFDCANVDVDQRSFHVKFQVTTFPDHGSLNIYIAEFGASREQNEGGFWTTAHIHGQSLKDIGRAIKGITG